MHNQDESRALLNPMQRRLVSVALVLLAVNLIGAIFIGLFLLLRELVTFFADVIWPLAVAGILALLLRPLVLWAQDRLRLGRTGSILTLYGLVVAACVAMIWLVLPEALRQAAGLLENLPGMLERLRDVTSQRYPELAVWLEANVLSKRPIDLWHQLGEHLNRIMEWSWPALSATGERIFRVFTLAAGVAIVPVYLFFFLLSDRDVVRDLDEQLSFIPNNARSDITFLIAEFARIMVAFFRGQILIGLIMGVLMAISFTLVGLKFGLLLGLVIGLLNIIPYLGTILGLLMVVPLAYFQNDGGFLLLAMVLGVFAAVQLLESYFLTPRIMGQSTGLHPLLIIIAIFFWGKALSGLLGMILAIPLTAFFVVVWRLLRMKYLPGKPSLYSPRV